MPLSADLYTNKCFAFFTILLTQVLALMGLIAMCTFSSPSLLRIETDLTDKGTRRGSYDELATEDDDDDDDDRNVSPHEKGGQKSKEPVMDDAEREVVKRMAIGFETGVDGFIEYGQSGPIGTQVGGQEERPLQEDVELGTRANEDETENANMCP